MAIFNSVLYNNFYIFTALYSVCVSINTMALIYQSCIETCAVLRAAGVTVRKILNMADPSVRISNKCGGWKRSSTIEVKKEALFGSMKTVKMLMKPRKTLLRTMTAVGAASPPTFCCYDAALHNNACSQTVEILIICQWPRKKQKTYTGLWQKGSDY